MAQPLPTRRTTSLTGSSRLSLGVERPTGSATPTGSGRHPLRQDWSISYVHRPPGAKVDYEKEIRRVATFGSIESFFHLYAHLTSPAELPPVTDILVFASRIQRPGVWEEMANGGKFTLRLLHPITPVLYETLLLALIGDNFDERDAVVGLVLSVRQTEDILSVWVEEEGEGVRSGALREKILSVLGLPETAVCEYRSNRALMDAASSLNREAQDGLALLGAGAAAALANAHGVHAAHAHHGHPHAQHAHHGHAHPYQHERGHGREHRPDRAERQERSDSDGRRGAWGQRHRDGQ
ncbi:hypothetical protein Q5752_006639 [Cryptotrichosporon argae]